MPGGYGQMPPPPPPSTRMLTATKWSTVGVAVLMTPLTGLLLMQGYRNLDFFRTFSARAARGSGNGRGLEGGADAIAHWEFLIKIEWATLVAVVLLGVSALLARPGQSWVRVVCSVLMLFPIAVIVYGVIGSGAEGLWGLVFLVPFFVVLVMWWLPGTSRGFRARRASSMPSVPPAPQHRY